MTLNEPQRCFQGHTPFFDADYLTNGYRHGISLVTIEGEYETAPKLSNGTSFNDLE